MITRQPVLQFYDLDLPLKLNTDASKHALEAILEQKHKKKSYLFHLYHEQQLQQNRITVL